MYSQCGQAGIGTVIPLVPAVLSYEFFEKHTLGLKNRFVAPKSNH
jgi:hypothetical protein